ncbi:MAG: hypothetical protein LHW59_10640 [Candidatus Cloacimonetes bacterium]|nr:hypothetical protein [Candidatus Cloacimonadota bacterium]
MKILKAIINWLRQKGIRMEKGKKLLLRLLEEPEIMQRIREICAASDSDIIAEDEAKPSSRNDEKGMKKINAELVRQKNEIQDLKRENSSLQNKNSELKKEAIELEKSRQKIAEECSRQIRQMQEEHNNALCEINVLLKNAQEELRRQQGINRSQQAELNATKQKFSSFQDIFVLYQGLPDSLRESLKGIFRGGDLPSFIICGAQNENLLAFWDFCKVEFNRGNLAHRVELLKIFDFFFELVNSKLFESPYYAKQELALGMSFDRDKFSSTSDSRVSGPLTELLLQGIVYATNGTIVRKSLVKVG